MRNTKYNMQKILKNEKGSISLFVLLSALFFLVVVTSVGVSFKNKERSIDSQLEKIKLSYEKDVGNESQIYAEESLKRTVTFDPNGGTVTPTSKVVKLGETYGELPTPTRDGYTFKGWNGKNLVNIQDQNISFNNNYYKDTTSSPKYTLKPDTTYIMSFDYKVNSSTNNIYDSVGYGISTFQKDISSTLGNYSNSGRKTDSFTTPSSFLYSPPYIWFRFVRMSTPGDANVDISNVQLEEGSTATEYEPYYVTSSTKVTQNNNDRYVLTAIWEPNE